MAEAPREEIPFYADTSNAEAFFIGAGVTGIIAVGKALRGKPASFSVAIALAGGLGLRGAELAASRALGRESIDTTQSLGQRARSLGAELATRTAQQTPIILKALAGSLNPQRSNRLP